MLRRVFLLSWIGLFLVSFGAGLSLAEQPTLEPKQEDYYELHKLLVDTMDEVERNYVKGISRRELIEAAIQGVLSKLDPYSSYIRPNDMEEFRTSVESEFGGIGIQLSLEQGRLVVLSPLVGTPAYRAGILAGDRIVEIDGKSTEGITMDEAVKQLKGPEGTEVTLGVTHPGKPGKVSVKITREVVHIETVLGDRRKADDSWDFMLDHERRIGYIRITAFSRDTPRELRHALTQLRVQNVRALVLDLRFNPGGLLPAAIEIGDMFISDGRIVSTSGRNTEERIWNAHKEGTFEGFSMVVLVNRYSASASEIVAACLQDHKRAIIAGERTWGKGSVQNVIELEDGASALKLTTAGYHRPSGKNIDRHAGASEDEEWGVRPDKEYELRLTDREMAQLLQNRRQRDILAPKPPVAVPPSAAPAASETARAAQSPPPSAQPAAAVAKPGETITATGDINVVDPQLRMALEYLSGELARADR